VARCSLSRAVNLAAASILEIACATLHFPVAVAGGIAAAATAFLDRQIGLGSVVFAPARLGFCKGAAGGFGEGAGRLDRGGVVGVVGHGVFKAAILKQGLDLPII